NPAYYGIMGSLNVSNATIICPDGDRTNLAECKLGSDFYCSSRNELFINCT
ncbi:hypothetical protein ACJMK2_032515, partial [Sinanodonta woodiana]